MELTYLYKGLKLSPPAVERIIARIPQHAYDTKTDPERFTLREAISHLADWEPINLYRLRQGVDGLPIAREEVPVIRSAGCIKL